MTESLDEVQLNDDSLPMPGSKSDKESFQRYEWMSRSETHKKKFENLLKQLQKGVKFQQINGVRVCYKLEFRIGEGSWGTTVYIGLGEDGSEKAVKRIPKAVVEDLGSIEKFIMNSPNAVTSSNVIKYFCYDDTSNDDFAYLIVDLCEENLHEFVNRQSEEELTRLAPGIIRQILHGLADLHRPQPYLILHRDLKPSNILRDVYDKWLLSDFGLSGVLREGDSSYHSQPRGNMSWRAVESFPASANGEWNDGKVKCNKLSDIQVAGMVCFYILTKGKHPFGNVADRLRNLLDGKPVGLHLLTDPSAKDLIDWMLQLKPEDRPSAEEALEHPYLQSDDVKFELLVCVSNQREIKIKLSTCNVVQQLNGSTGSWKTQIRPDVLAYLCSDGNRPLKYGDEWTECLRLIRNVVMHWNDRPRPRPKVHYDVGEPKEYFLRTFPNLPVRVHRIVRNCPDWEKRPELRKFFSTSAGWSKTKEPGYVRDESKNGRANELTEPRMPKMGRYERPTTVAEDLRSGDSSRTVEDMIDERLDAVQVDDDSLPVADSKSDKESPKQCECMPSSNTHREKIEKLRELLRKGEKIPEINGVRVWCKPEFEIGEGSRGTMVYIGLDSDGDGKAVKRIFKAAVRDLSENEKEILKSPNAVDSKNVLNYFCYDDKSNDDFAYLIVDLCEENLKEFVKRQSVEELTRLAPGIIREILQGLEDLHRPQPNQILHRDLKPPNILRCVRGTNVRWLLADFGISRMVPEDASSLYTDQSGTPDWLSVDSYHDAEGTVVLNGGKVKCKKQSDIQVAGMVCFYILTKGEYAFGNVADRLQNLLAGKPVGLDKVTDPSAKDLISWMLQLKPEDRPSAGEALKHPYLLSDDQKFKLLVCVGNEPEVKSQPSTCKVVQQLNGSTDSWKTQIPPDFMDFFCWDGRKYRSYGNEWTECLRLIRNVKVHWNDYPSLRPKDLDDVGSAQRYFLTTFPDLPVQVHRIIRSHSDWKEKEDLKEFFGTAQSSAQEIETVR